MAEPVNHRGAAIHVLNQMQNMRTVVQPPDTWINGIGRAVVGEKQGESSAFLESGSVSIAKRDNQLQRKRVSMQLSRGQKLSTKLVKELGLGILFSPKIW